MFDGAVALRCDGPFVYAGAWGNGILWNAQKGGRYEKEYVAR